MIFEPWLHVHGGLVNPKVVGIGLEPIHDPNRIVNRTSQWLLKNNTENTYN